MRAEVPFPRSPSYTRLTPSHCTARRFVRIAVKADASQTLSELSRIHANNNGINSSEILRIRKSLMSREQTAVEITQEYLTRIQQTEPNVKSFLHISDKVLMEASQIDETLARNEEVGMLAGVPIAVKDNLCTNDMPSTAGSRILEGYRPPFDATAVTKLRQHGALLIGKTNLDEFGMGSTTEGSAYQEVPDYPSKLLPIEALDSKPLKGIKVGIIRETLGEGVDTGVISSIQTAALHLEELGATLREVSLASFSLGLPAYYVLASSEASSNLARYDNVRYGHQVPADDLESMYGGSRAKGFGPEVKRRILTGTYALSAGYYDAYYKRAQQVRTLIQKDFSKALEGTDILISPAAPTAAYKIGEKANDPLSMYAGDIMTVNVNMAGLPALVVPCGFVKDGETDLPVGLQMIGAAFEEERLLELGHVFQQTLLNQHFLATAPVK
ncbi:glutamyl-tRNA(Gln) amidotransferase subunit A, chloroplastic/mitochondrial isoform X2 [Cryptomeria japonica]|uniref:glutamyl-tRNA(Gln) amidotransferase subunit A, chloroplastic/mitochondrial isoform X2 n=1 Tax=Cryptomeria japonica TaxID=3369 RepID=UPI0027D9F61A|nr:glutamyl-tRNA(Gln) amidotransferase subunit A, chloroplastic/mitochondrial isoform X2 [Cryptomeria japonica]